MDYKKNEINMNLRYVSTEDEEAVLFSLDCFFFNELTDIRIMQFFRSQTIYKKIKLVLLQINRLLLNKTKNLHNCREKETHKLRLNNILNRSDPLF